MPEKIYENNMAVIAGEVVGNFEFSHRIMGEGIYKGFVKSNRLSASADIIPVMVSERLIAVDEDWTGSFIKITGQVRTHNTPIEGTNKSKLTIYLFAREIEVLDECEDINKVTLTGHLCKSPKYRETPLGREITDIILAVNRPYKKSDYIPCITWGRNARYISAMDVGEIIHINGRFQSRDYIKTSIDGEKETRTAYEISVTSYERIEEDEENE